METKYRLLKPSEIDVRIGTVGAKGVTLLLYKDARAYDAELVKIAMERSLEE